MPSHSRLVRTSPGDISAYVPDLPDDDWQHIREFVARAAQDAMPPLAYSEPSVVNAIAHHVDWCVNVAGPLSAPRVIVAPVLDDERLRTPAEANPLVESIRIRPEVCRFLGTPQDEADLAVDELPWLETKRVTSDGACGRDVRQHGNEAVRR